MAGDSLPPLPPGFNSAAELDWSRQNEDGSPLATADIDSLVLHNTIGDWIAYAAQQPTLTDAERAVVEQLPDWDGVRGSPWGEDVLRPMIESLLAGDRTAAATYAQRAARLRAEARPRG